MENDVGSGKVVYVASNGELDVNSLQRRNPKKARVKAAQSITLSTESVNWGRSAAWRNSSSFTVIGHRSLSFSPLRRFRPFKHFSSNCMRSMSNGIWKITWSYEMLAI